MKWDDSGDIRIRISRHNASNSIFLSHVYYTPRREEEKCSVLFPGARIVWRTGRPSIHPSMGAPLCLRAPINICLVSLCPSLNRIFTPEDRERGGERGGERGREGERERSRSFASSQISINFVGRWRSTRTRSSERASEIDDRSIDRSGRGRAGGGENNEGKILRRHRASDTNALG